MSLTKLLDCKDIKQEGERTQQIFSYKKQLCTPSEALIKKEIIFIQEQSLSRLICGQ